MRIKLLVAGMSAAVTVAFLFGLLWGFITLILLIMITFFELERREIELEEINLAAVCYLSNNSFSIGVTFTIIGMVLLSPAFLIKNGGAYWHEWQKVVSNSLYALQLRLFLIAILFLAVGFFLTNRDLKGGNKY